MNTLMLGKYSVRSVYRLVTKLTLFLGFAVQIVIMPEVTDG